MSIDPGVGAGFVFLGLLPIALSLVFFYAVTPINHRYVAKGRRLLLRNDYQRWPFRNVMPGLLPTGIGIALLCVGRTTEGQPWTLDRLPTDLPQSMMAVGLVWFIIGFWFMIRPPQWVLPAWYRTVDSHRQTLPLRAVVMSLDLVSEIQASRASVEAVMASALVERSGMASTSDGSPTVSMSEAAAHLETVTGQVPDRELVRLVGAWRRAFAAASAGPGAGFATALAVAPDSEWQVLINASGALLAHLTQLHDVIARDLPQI